MLYIYICVRYVVKAWHNWTHLFVSLLPKSPLSNTREIYRHKPTRKENKGKTKLQENFFLIYKADGRGLTVIKKQQYLNARYVSDIILKELDYET